ncbi:MAG: PorV/PorQ family protein [Elusimicrobiota bacterium]
MRTPRPLALALLLALPGTAGAEAGLTAAPFLRRSLGARAAGMGTAFTAVRGSADSMHYNPGALSTLTRKTFSSTYLKGFAGATHGAVTYAHPFRFITLGAGAVYYNAGPIDLNLSDGTTGRVTAEENLAGLFCLSARLFPGFHVGGTYRFVRLELAEAARTTTSQGDFGALWRVPVPKLGLSLGGAYQYLGPDIKFEEAEDPPPRTLRYGLALHFPEVDPKTVDPSVDLTELDVTLAADMVQSLHERRSPRVGAEFGMTPSYINRIAMRFGWVFGRDAESFTFGMGIQQGRFGLDYAFGEAKDLSSLHHLTMAFRF